MIQKKLVSESKLACRVIRNIVDSACKTNEDYIIDGVQSLPQFLPLNKIHYCIITVSDSIEHKKRFEHPTKTRGSHLNNATIDTVRIIQDFIIKEAEKYKIPIFDNLSSLNETSAKITRYFRL